jgi:pantetheine-phosphate adenylyltransferase
MKKKIGIYAGTFSPLHVGHKDILDQALNLFDEVHLAVGNNPTKDLSNREPLPKMLTTMKGLTVSHYNGLLSDYLNKVSWDNDDAEVYLVRGLRNGEDLAYEDNQLRYLKSMYPSLRVLFFRCAPEFDHISSSSLKNLRKFSESEYKKYTFE